MPQRIQLKRTKDWKMPANTIKVDRSTRWGNPFKIKRLGDNWNWMYEVIHRMFDNKNDAASYALTEFREYIESAIRQNPKLLEPLRGKNLACWCKLGELCHADILLELANAEP